MSMWKETTTARLTPTPAPEAREPSKFDAPSKPELVPTPASPPLPRADTGLPRKESLIAGDIAIEGKIEGGGSVRVAGKFKGDVNVQGDLTIESGAKLTGSVRADKVTIAGELEDLPLPYTFDVQAYGAIHHPPLREHIDRVGKSFYARTEPRLAAK